MMYSVRGGEEIGRFLYFSVLQVTAAVDKAYEIAPGELDDGVKAIKYEAYVEWMMGSQT